MTIDPDRMVRYWYQLDNQIICDGQRMKAKNVPGIIARRIQNDPQDEVFESFYEWNHLGHKTWQWVRPA